MLTLTIDGTDPHSAADVRGDLMALAGTLHAGESISSATASAPSMR